MTEPTNPRPVSDERIAELRLILDTRPTEDVRRKVLDELCALARSPAPAAAPAPSIMRCPQCGNDPFAPAAAPQAAGEGVSEAEIGAWRKRCEAWIAARTLPCDLLTACQLFKDADTLIAATPARETPAKVYLVHYADSIEAVFADEAEARAFGDAQFEKDWKEHDEHQQSTPDTGVRQTKEQWRFAFGRHVQPVEVRGAARETPAARREAVAKAIDELIAEIEDDIANGCQQRSPHVNEKRAALLALIGCGAGGERQP